MFKGIILTVIVLLFLTGCGESFDYAYSAFRSPKNSVPAVSIQDISGWQTSPVTLIGSATDSDNDSLSCRWSEVTSYGVTFTAPDSFSTGIAFTGNTNGDVAVNAIIRLAVSDGEDETYHDMNLQIYRNDVIFVTPDGTGSGNHPESPLKGVNATDLAYAISYAKDSGKTIVALAAGTYEISTTPTSPALVLKEGISLYGGYSPSDWKRNLQSNESVIRDMNVYSTAQGAIQAGTGITDNTILNGIVVEIGRGVWAIGIYCTASAGLTVKDCTIRSRTDGADINTYQQFGIYLSPCGNVDIKGCTITLGDVKEPATGSTWSVGIGLVGSGNVLIEGNKIYPGRAKSNGTISTNSYAINTFNINTNVTSVKIINNLLSSGISENGTASGINLYQTTSTSYTYTIQNNTISALNTSDIGVNTVSSCIRVATSTGMVNIDNNIFISAGFLRTYCLYLYDTHKPASLLNNLFYTDPSTSSKFVFTSFDVKTYNDLTTLIDTLGYNLLSAGNINENLHNYLVDYDGPDNDILTLIDNDWHIVKSIHTPMNLLYGGIDLSSTLLYDYDGIPRTNLNYLKATNSGAGGLTIGAYEKD